jgi:hypothetical protein
MLADKTPESSNFPLRSGFDLRMQAFVTVIGLLLTVSSASAANNLPAAPHLIRAQGILLQLSDLHWQILLDDDQSIQYKRKTAEMVRFTVDTFTEATWCQPNQDKNIEISGELKSVSNGVATITLDTIIPGPRGPVPVSETVRKFLTKEPDPNEHAPGEPLYRFAYYLVLLDPAEGCERCYVPLLIAPESLDTAAERKQSLDTVWITTYERDSIWQVDAVGLLTSNAIDASSKTIRFRGKNYRYELVADSDVLRLLEHPMGTIPISRIFLPNSKLPGANISDLAAGFHTLLRVRERQGRPVLNLGPLETNSSAHAVGVPKAAVLSSELTVFDDGGVEYRTAPGCSSRFLPAEIPKSRVTVESWNWRETCPGSQRTETKAEYSLTHEELSYLMELLNRKAVAHAADCFCNAAPISDDYAIEIPREDSIQKVSVTAFMPEHFELREHPAITYLVCEAKMIEGKLSLEAVPDWCKDLPPLK